MEQNKKGVRFLTEQELAELKDGDRKLIRELEGIDSKFVSSLNQETRQVNLDSMIECILESGVAPGYTPGANGQYQKSFASTFQQSKNLNTEINRLFLERDHSAYYTRREKLLIGLSSVLG
ncbi:MAG: hypothetical protein V1659_01265, partial [Candidatus Woesearchaeota archaeon]